MKPKTTTENGFKQTEIGQIPEDWGIRTVGEVGEYINGYAFKPSDWKEEGKPIIRIQNLNDSAKKYNYYQGKLPDKYKIRKGDILISWSASLGTFRWYGQEAWLNQHIFKALPDKEFLTEDYFYWVMYYSINTIASKARGSTMRHVTAKEFKNSLIQMPLISEQQKIAAVLSKLQQAIAHQENIIGKTKELKRSLMHRLFTYGMRGEELKETEIGLMPESWSAKRLKDVVEKTSQRDMTKTPDIQFKYIDVSSISNESLKIIGSTTYKGSEAPSRARKIIRVNDVLFATVRPTLKRIAYVGSEFDGEICSTAFCVLRSVSTLSSRYLYFCVQRDSFIESLGKLQRGASYPAVTDGNVKVQLIPFPTLDEQEEIANILWDIDNKINHETAKKNMLKDLFKSMLQLLMTGQVRVKDVDFGEDCG